MEPDSQIMLKRLWYSGNLKKISKTICLKALLSHNGILSVHEKLPVSEFQYFGNYIIQFDSYFYVRITIQRQTGLRNKNRSTSPGTMVHVVFMLFVFLAVFKKIESIIYIRQHASTCPRCFH